VVTTVWGHRYGSITSLLIKHIKIGALITGARIENPVFSDLRGLVFVKRVG
jgi:hypothetical protein